MKKTIAFLLLAVMLTSFAGGCANIKNDATRTKTEGTLMGAAGGAALGAGVGAAVAGRGGALIGAGIGLLAGGIAGFFVGSHIADQKEKYASEEEWLDACLTQAQETNTKIKEYNNNLTAEIAKADSQTKSLQAAYAKQQVNRRAMRAERKKLKGLISDTNGVIASIDKEIAGQEKVAADAKANNKSDEAALLDAEIAALQRQKAQLEESNKQLASMSSRISL